MIEREWQTVALVALAIATMALLAGMQAIADLVEALDAGRALAAENRVLKALVVADFAAVARTTAASD